MRNFFTETENENKQFKETKSWISNSNYQGTVVNRTLPSLHGGTVQGSIQFVC